MTRTRLLRKYQSDVLTLDAQRRTGEITSVQHADASARLVKEMSWRGLITEGI